MGVKHFWKMAKPYGKAESPQGKRLAVDASIWMHQLVGVPDRLLPYVISKRILKLLFHEISPVFVFDGSMPPLKRQIKQIRRTDEIRRWLENNKKKCCLCGSELSGCLHMKTLSPLDVEKLNQEVLRRISSHQYDWGEFSEESEEKGSSDGSADAHGSSDGSSSGLSTPADDSGASGNEETAEEGVRIDGKRNPILSFNLDEFEKLNKSQKMERLIDLREKRGLPMEYDNTEPLNFSLSQVENVKRRNMITSLMINLDEKNKNRIQSDWRVEVKYDGDGNNQGSARLRGAGSSPSSSTDTGETRRDRQNGWSRDEKGGEAEDVMDYSPTVIERREAPDGSAASLEKYRRLLEEVCRGDDDDGWETCYEKAEQTAGGAEAAGKEEGGGTQSRAFTGKPVQADESESSSDGFGVRPTSAGAERQRRPRHSAAGPASELGQFENEFFDQISFTNAYEPFDNKIEKIKEQIKQLLGIFGIPFIESPEEADSQCALLFEMGDVDGVVTEDNDLLIQKATVYKNFFSLNQSIMVYRYEDVAAGLGIDSVGMIKLSYLLGSDYSLGVKGIGPKKVLEAIKTVEEEDIDEIRRLYECGHVRKVPGLRMTVLHLGSFRRFLKGTYLYEQHVGELMFLARACREKQVAALQRT